MRQQKQIYFYPRIKPVKFSGNTEICMGFSSIYMSLVAEKNAVFGCVTTDIHL